MGNDVMDQKSTQQAEFAGFAFSPEMIQGDDGDGFLRHYRAEAWRAFERLPYPTSDDEAWRRTSLAGLGPDFRLPERDAYRGLAPPPEAIVGSLDRDQLGGRIIMLPGGMKRTSSESCCQNGVLFTDFESASQQHPDQLERALGAMVKPEEGKFAALAGALARNGVFVYVPKDVQVERPLHSLVWAAGEGLAHFSHLIIWLEQGASLTYVHEFASPQGAVVQSLHSGLIEVHVGANADLQFVELQSLGDNAWNFLQKRACVDRDGRMDWVFGAIGSQVSKDCMDLSLVGEGAQGRFSGFYFADGDQHLDHDTQQNHRAAHTHSDLLVKGALKGSSRSVWRGMIYVAPEAQRADGYQANPNLMLSDQAHADSIPGLEILADDVRCTHGATVGQMDPETLFYLRSRGIAAPQAERLIVEGFFEPILADMPFDQVRTRFLSAIREKIGVRV